MTRDSFLKNRFFFLYGLIFLSLSLHSVEDLPQIQLTQRQLCDLELLLNKGFYPLEGFMDKETYEKVVKEMRLKEGSIFPIPIVLDVNKELYLSLKSDSKIALKDSEGTLLAILYDIEAWRPDKVEEAKKVYGTLSEDHPGVSYLFHQTGDYYVGGKIKKMGSPVHYDFMSLRKSPDELRSFFKSKGFKKIVGFQTRNPLHRAHLELTLRAAKEGNCDHLLLHPSVGLTKPGDVDHFTRVKCYQKLMSYYPEGKATLSLLPLAMRMAGPREALWHALIRKNYGCTHFIVGRDHAGPGKDSFGQDFYHPYAAQKLAIQYENELGIKIIPFQEMVYVKEDDNYQPVDEVPTDKTILRISGTELRKLLREGKEIPEWFSFPDVISELKKVFPSRSKQGFVLIIRGTDSSKNLRIANGLNVRLMELQDLPITLLDEDSLKHNIREKDPHLLQSIALYMAREIVKHHGIILFNQDLFNGDLLRVKEIIGREGNLVEVFSTQPEADFFSEEPDILKIVLDEDATVLEQVNAILDFLTGLEYIK